MFGFVVFKAMAYFKVNGLHFGFAQMTKMDKPGLISLLPNFVLFVVFVISGSKARWATFEFGALSDF